jgi:Calcineurin-like phosphoesterase
MRRTRRLALLFLLPLLVVFLSMWAAGPTPVSMGPYVQNVTATSADICWFDEVPRGVVVHVDGPDGEEFNRNSAATSGHRVRIEGLRPDLRYGYNVVTEAGEVVGAGSFKTSSPDPALSFTFAAVGDSGRVPRWLRMRSFGWERIGDLFPRTKQWEVGEWIAARQPDLFVHLGDIIYSHDQLPAYQEAFFRPFADVLRSAPLVATLGNHDMHTWAHPEFFRIFHTPEPLDPAENYTDFSFTFTRGAIRFLVIDAFWQRWEPGSKKRAWLEKILAARSHPRTIVIIHNPAFTDEAGVTESALIQKQLWPLFVKHGVAMIVSGDSHNYQRFKPVEGVTQVIVGTGGKSIRPVAARRLAHHEERFGFLLVKVVGTRIEGEFWAGGDAPLDRFVIE